MRAWFGGVRERYGNTSFALAGGVVVAAFALVLVAVWPAQAGTVELWLERADEVGPDPFTDSLSFTEVTVPGELQTISFGAGITVVPGTAPGLYGGTGSDVECDPARLIAFLEAEPDKAAAWAGVQGIEVDEIADYIGGLTPAVLLEDTWVTNHGYRDGRATPRQSVLQAGTAILVDDEGVPRARCKCGNPLTPPQVPSDLGRVELVGEPWDGFDLGEVVQVEPATFTAEGLFLTRLPDGQAIFRPTGTTGDQDVLVDEDGRFIQEVDGEELPEAAPAGSGPYPLPLQTNAGFPIEYEVTGPCRWDGEELSLTGSGTCEVVGSAEGDEQWAPFELSSTIEIEALEQLIAVPEIGVLVVGEEPVPLEASADSGLPLVYSTEGPCEVVDGAIRATGEGVCILTIEQEGDDEWAAAEPVVIEIEILGETEAGEREAQTISFSLAGSMQLGSSGLRLNATSSSGLPVTFTVSGPCRISGGRLEPQAPGTCRVTAVQAGDEDVQRATATETVTVLAQQQTVDLSGLPGELRSDGSAPLPGSSSAGLPVSYTTSGPCTVSGGQLRATGAGTCTLTASVASNATTAAFRTSVTVEIIEVLVEAQDQTISFPAPGGLTFGGSGVGLSASASSGLPVTYTVTAGPCSLSGSTLTATGAGSCTVVASQPGNAAFNPAPSVSQTVTVARAGQTVSIDAPGTMLVEDSATVGGSSSAGLPVALSASGACRLAGSTLTATTEGTCTIAAEQAGNGDYDPASTSRTVTVSKRTQTIDVSAPGSMEVFSSAAVSASATSGLPVEVSVSGPCEFPGSTLEPFALGTCTITASQAGNGAWEAAPTRTVNVTITQAQQTINYRNIGTQELSAEIPLDATTSSGLPVEYSESGGCVIDQPSLFAIAVGTCTLTITQPGTAEYAPATITRTFDIVRRSQTISFSPLSDAFHGSNGQPIVASASSGLPIQFSVSGPCILAGAAAVVVPDGSAIEGRCTVTATQNGDGEYAPAAPVSQSFQVFNR
ncbi:MAG: DUF6777 domain-containing protein [Actinomycetota bacterium]